MPQTRARTAVWIHTKVCPCCGYRGREMQAIHDWELFVCPRCRGDLYARPPMSYAEMEGLVPGLRRHPGESRRDDAHQRVRPSSGRLSWLRRLLAGVGLFRG